MKVERLFLRYAITPAQLLYHSTPAAMRISKKHGELRLEREPLQLTIDNRAFHDSLGIKGRATQSREYAQRGRQAASDATAQYAREGDMMLGPNAMSPAQIVASRVARVPGSELAFIPSERPKLHWSGGKVHVSAERDQVHIEWRPHRLDFRYVPYSIEYYLDKW